MSRTQARLTQLESKQGKRLPEVRIVFSIVERDDSGQLWCIGKRMKDKETGQLIEISNQRRPIDG